MARVAIPGSFLTFQRLCFSLSSYICRFFVFSPSSLSRGISPHTFRTMMIALVNRNWVGGKRWGGGLDLLCICALSSLVHSLKAWKKIATKNSISRGKEVCIRRRWGKKDWTLTHVLREIFCNPAWDGMSRAPKRHLSEEKKQSMKMHQERP